MALEEKIDGYYTISNSMGYGVILSDCGSSAKLVLDLEKKKTTPWLDIEWVPKEDGELDDEGFPEMEAVIDPDGYDVPLSLVMRAR